MKLRKKHFKLFAAILTFSTNTLVDKLFQLTNGKASNLEIPKLLNYLDYSTEQNELADFSKWLDTLISTQDFVNRSKKYIDIQKRLKTEDDDETRHYLVEAASQLEQSLWCKTTATNIRFGKMGADGSHFQPFVTLLCFISGGQNSARHQFKTSTFNYLIGLRFAGRTTTLPTSQAPLVACKHWQTSLEQMSKTKFNKQKRKSNFRNTKRLLQETFYIGLCIIPIIIFADNKGTSRLIPLPSLSWNYQLIQIIGLLQLIIDSFSHLKLYTKRQLNPWQVCLLFFLRLYFLSDYLPHFRD